MSPPPRVPSGSTLNPEKQAPWRVSSWVAFLPHCGRGFLLPAAACLLSAAIMCQLRALSTDFPRISTFLPLLCDSFPRLPYSLPFSCLHHNYAFRGNKAKQNRMSCKWNHTFGISFFLSEHNSLEIRSRTVWAWLQGHVYVVGQQTPLLLRGPLVASQHGSWLPPEGEQGGAECSVGPTFVSDTPSTAGPLFLSDSPATLQGGEWAAPLEGRVAQNLWPERELVVGLSTPDL